MRARSAALTLVLGVAAAACASSTPEDDAKIAADSAALTEPSLNVAATRYLGKIANGQTLSARYTATPLYQSYGFEAKGGDVVTAYVAAADGDAMAWITDDAFHILASNDDASPQTLDSRVTYTVPLVNTSHSYRLVFRELRMKSEAFTTRFTIDASAGICKYNGQMYNPGDAFDSADGCNTCECEPSGAVECTKQVCDCDPANEPWHTYFGTPAQCVQLLYSCPSGEQHFANSCGCGCERPH